MASALVATLRSTLVSQGNCTSMSGHPDRTNSPDPLPSNHKGHHTELSNVRTRGIFEFAEVAFDCT